VIRRFNYTDRKRIPSDRVDFQIRPSDGAPSFDARLDLTGLELPTTSRVYVEAYYKSSLQRFDFGTVASVVTPGTTVLDQVDQGNLIYFRVKVVDTDGKHGRLVAEVDGLHAAGRTGANRFCILPVNFVDLGEQLWRLSFAPPQPVLEVNSFSGAEGFVRSDPMFMALVYPEVVRQVLRNILIDSDLDDLDGLNEWQDRWVRFAKTFHPEEIPASGADDDDARTRWVEEVVRCFCEKLKMRTRLVEAIAQEGK
jgi:hypothetical protein